MVGGTRPIQLGKAPTLQERRHDLMPIDVGSSKILNIIATADAVPQSFELDPLQREKQIRRRRVPLTLKLLKRGHFLR